jgi:hypothetical protein
MVKAKNTAYIPKSKDFIYLEYDKKYFIETLRKPYGQMISSAYFEAEMILWILSDKKRLEEYMTDFNERHKQQIIDMNIDVPKMVITNIEKITIFMCPYCYIEFPSIKEQREHITNCNKNPLKEDQDHIVEPLTKKI